MNKNQVEIDGSVVTPPRYRDNDLFELSLSSPRLSGVCDLIPVRFSPAWIPMIPAVGSPIRVQGELRSSYHPKAEIGSRLYLYCLAHTIQAIPAPTVNQIMVTGRLEKPVTFRITPAGWEISDLLLSLPETGSLHRTFLPCIAWRQIARRLSQCHCGDQLAVIGRFQSRIFQKNGQELTAREISIHTICELLDSNPSKTTKIYI